MNIILDKTHATPTDGRTVLSRATRTRYFLLYLRVQCVPSWILVSLPERAVGLYVQLSVLVILIICVRILFNLQLDASIFLASVPRGVFIIFFASREWPPRLATYFGKRIVEKSSTMSSLPPYSTYRTDNKVSISHVITWASRPSNPQSSLRNSC